MNNKQIGLILQVAGIGLGAVALILLLTRHPILMGMNAVGAVMYFVGVYLKKN